MAEFIFLKEAPCLFSYRDSKNYPTSIFCSFLYRQFYSDYFLTTSVDDCIYSRNYSLFLQVSSSIFQSFIGLFSKCLQYPNHHFLFNHHNSWKYRSPQWSFMILIHYELLCVFLILWTIFLSLVQVFDCFTDFFVFCFL